MRKWSKLDPEVRRRTDALDALGNTTAATGKGFAIGSAALTALALLASYIEELKISILHWSEATGNTMYKINDAVSVEVSKITTCTLSEFMGYFQVTLMNPKVLMGLFVGAMMSFLFCGLTMNAVGRAAEKMVKEVAPPVQGNQGHSDRGGGTGLRALRGDFHGGRPA